jgi:Tn3 transposase DDE domain
LQLTAINFSLKPEKNKSFGLFQCAAERLSQFGGNGVITENDRAEQRKRIKYNHLLANRLIFHNVHAMTAALHRLLREGVIVKEESLRYLSPYGAEHINRFGIYEWNRRHVAPSLDYELEILSMQSFSRR